MGEDVDPRQIVVLDADLTNIVLLDFILSQQDRVGNIDYTEHWYWVENGEMKSRKAVPHGDETEPSARRRDEAEAHPSERQRRGRRVEYANFAKSTGMLDDLTTFRPHLPPASGAGG
jgi:hypothetical protein